MTKFDIVIGIGIAHGQIPAVRFGGHGHLGFGALGADTSVAQEERAFDTIGQGVIPIAEEPMRFLRDDKDLLGAVALGEVAEVVDIGAGGFFRKAAGRGTALFDRFGGLKFVNVLRDFGGSPAPGGGLAFRGRCFRFGFRSFGGGFGRFFHGDTNDQARQGAGEFRLMKRL